MINLQTPTIPQQLKATDIDRYIYLLQLLLDKNLNWLTNAYGRAYRNIQKNDKTLYLPEIYLGGDKYSYHLGTPDNDKKGTCFFTVGKETLQDYEANNYTTLNWNVGIIFWVNLKLIDAELLKTDYFLQNLIKDVRDVLIRKGGFTDFHYKINEVVTSFSEMFSGFNLNEAEDYLRSPYGGFRVNLTLTSKEECKGFIYDPSKAILNNFSKAEKLVILESLDFTDVEIFSKLTTKQRTDLKSLL